MTVKTVTCLELTCDLCGEVYDIEAEGYTHHFADLPAAVKYLRDDEWKVQPGGYALCPADDAEHVAARKALAPAEAAEQIEGQVALPVEAEAVCGFRVGDRVQITGRGDIFDGKTGEVVKVDGRAGCPIGLAVDGFIGPVWCDPGEIRHADAAQDAPAETAGSAT